MIYSDRILVKTFIGSTLSEMESKLNGWVAKQSVLVVDLKHSNIDKRFVWVVLFKKSDQQYELIDGLK